MLCASIGQARGVVGQTLVAAANPRCNHDVAGMLERRVRGYDRHPPAQNADALSRRYLQLNSILQQAQVEHDILHELCTGAEFAAPADQLAGVVAWAYALEADITVQHFTALKCPQTATTAAQALLADAWYALATTYATGTPPAEAPSPTPAPLVAEVTPKVKSRAGAVGLELPAFADATEYWRDTMDGKVVLCPTAAP